MTNHKGTLIEVREALHHANTMEHLHPSTTYRLNQSLTKLDALIEAVPDWGCVVAIVNEPECVKENKILAINKWAIDSAKLLSDAVSEGE